MHRLLLGAAAAFVVAVLPLSAQSRDDARAVVRDITSSLVEGNGDVIARVSAAQVELTIGGQTSVYTKAQAGYVTGAFLDQHPLREGRVQEVNVVGRQCTARSRLTGSDGSESWDLFLRLRRTREGWELKELRLTPSEGKGDRPG